MYIIGEIDLSEDNVETILSTANILQITEVVNACCNFLANRLHPSNCIGFSLFSEAQGCMGLHQMAHTYVMVTFIHLKFKYTLHASHIQFTVLCGIVSFI